VSPAPAAIVRGLGRAYPFLKMPTRHGSRGRWVFLVFRPGEREPSWVVKGSRDPRGVPALRGERNALARLHEAIGRCPLAARVPRLLGYEESDSETILVETFVAGMPLSARLAKPDGAADALEWLVRFHEVSRSRPQRIEASDLAAAARAAAPHLGDPTLEPVLAERIAPLEGLLLPHGLVHGDFEPRNILRDSPGLGVIDWEESQDGALVSDDVLRYAASAEILGIPLARSAVSATLRRLGVAPDQEPALRLHFLARAAAQAAALCDAPADADSQDDGARWSAALRRAIGSEHPGLRVG
jgi:aminoglycoside phosphotransferase (APT) family kinase protein